MQFRLTGATPPVVGAFDLQIQAAPFGQEPAGSLEFSARGIRGAGITEVWPGLRERIDGRPLTDGRVSFKCSAVYHGRRRHAFDFALEKGFGVSFLLEDLRFRSGEEGAVLAGVEEIDLQVKNLVPATGAVHVSRLEIGKPVFRARTDEAGLHAMGVIVKSPERSTARAAPPGRGGRAEIAPAAGPASPPRDGRPPEAPPEIRVDKLLVSGIDFQYRDGTATPPLVVPLNDFEVEVSNFSSRALTEPLPVPFKVRLGAGDVRPAEPRGVGPVEQPLFQEIITAGGLAFSPRLRGRVKTVVSMLDLTALRGVAAKQGIQINRGLVDSSVDMVFEPNGNLEIESNTVFTDLSMSEPPGGAIGRFLMLPAPLDTVIFVLRDRGGAVRVPLSFTVDARSGVSTTAITAEAVKVFGLLVGEALAKSPFRLVGAVTDFTGLTGGGEVRGAGEPVVVPFTPGVTQVEADEQAKIDQVLARLRERSDLAVVLSAELGSEDLAHARARANPSREDCLALLLQLRRRKAAILEERETVLARARAVVAARLDQQVEPHIRQLRALDRELGQLERSLDQLGLLLHPRADRYASRRTRLAALALASARLRTVHGTLLERGGPELEKRIRVTRPRFDAEPTSKQGSVKLRPVIRVVP